MHRNHDLQEWRGRIETAARSLLDRRGRRPRIAMFLGTGHSEFANRLEKSDIMSVDEIPEFPPGVEASTLALGSYGGIEVIVADAPLAPYLGVSGIELAFPVRMFRRMGAEILILTAATAALKPGCNLGDLALVEDHLNFTNMNPLQGHNDDILGPRFPDMIETYDVDLRVLGRDVAADAGFPLHEGVFAAIAGPSLPTRAEYRFLRSAGADFVGMSTVPEAITAAHAGFRMLALLGITQLVRLATPKATDLETMVDAADLAAPRMATMLGGIVERLAQA